jgi:hypothetical protein
MASLSAKTSWVRRWRTLITVAKPPLPRSSIQSKSDASTSDGGGALIVVVSRAAAVTWWKIR